MSSNETPTDDYYDTAFLNVIGAGNTTTWNSTILIDGHEVPFKLDTGAEVMVISADVLATLTSPSAQAKQAAVWARQEAIGCHR